MAQAYPAAIEIWSTANLSQPMESRPGQSDQKRRKRVSTVDQLQLTSDGSDFMPDDAAMMQRERASIVAQIIRSGGNRPAEEIAEEILVALEGAAVFGYAFTQPNGMLIVNSVRDTREAVRLAAGEGNPIEVLIVPLSS
jgi:adenosine/AMP kinase